MVWFRTFIASVLTLILLATPAASMQAQADATIELHWRDCATLPSEGVSWYDHCHDGPLRGSVSGERPATFTDTETSENYTGELNGNGDMILDVPAGTYRFEQPPGHDAEAMDFICSYLDEHGNAGEPLEDPTNISLESGDHVVCDFFAVWGEGGAGVLPLEPDDPQGTIEIRWRACAEASTTDEEWFDDCFEEDSDHGTERQENRRITVRNVESNIPWGGLLDEEGNVQVAIPPGSYIVPTMHGDFVTADFLYCSEVNEAGTAEDMDITADPLVIEDGMHVICDYYFVAE